MKSIYIPAFILLYMCNVEAYQSPKDPNDLSNFGWKVPVAMTKQADPHKMQLYLTKDLKMIWAANNIADNFGRAPRHPITSTNDFINHHLGVIDPYTKLISYANVDFKNMKQKQERNILQLINKEFAYRTFYTLKMTYNEIMGQNLSKKKVRDFTIEDVEILKKDDNMCIVYNEDVINPTHNLEASLASLRKRGFSNTKAEDQIVVKLAKRN